MKIQIKMRNRNNITRNIVVSCRVDKIVSLSFSRVVIIDEDRQGGGEREREREGKKKNKSCTHCAREGLTSRPLNSIENLN